MAVKRRAKTKTRRRTKDVDQIIVDLQNRTALEEKYLAPPTEDDEPVLGKWYCVECARHFDQLSNLMHHKTGKQHKRRARLTSRNAYTQAEADAAGGVGTDTFYSAQDTGMLGQ